jgi:hypothetical protein
MPSPIAHLITDSTAPVDLAFASTVHAELAKLPRKVRQVRKLELAQATAQHSAPATPVVRTPAGTTGEINPELVAWWGEYHPEQEHGQCYKIRWAAKMFCNTSRADFIATLVSVGVNPSTAGVQFKKGRGQ